MTDARPYPKSAQLARSKGRSFRKHAGKDEWAAIAAEKHGPCRLCCDPGRNGGHEPHALIELHHLIARSQGGDDVAANIVPLCRKCHAAVTEHRRLFVGGQYRPAREALVELLTDAEREYVIGKRGELRL